MMEEILIGMGGNLPSAFGGPDATVREALSRLEDLGIFLNVVSPYYKTSPVPASDQPDFVNLAAIAQTSLTADDVLRAFQELERLMGRQPAERWSARTLDIDLLAYGERILPNLDVWQEVQASSDPSAILAEPVVPHPRLHKRAFVLIPLADIAPKWRHPVFSETIETMLATLDMAGQGVITLL